MSSVISFIINLYLILQISKNSVSKTLEAQLSNAFSPYLLSHPCFPHHSSAPAAPVAAPLLRRGRGRLPPRAPREAPNFPALGGEGRGRPQGTRSFTRRRRGRRQVCPATGGGSGSARSSRPCASPTLHLLPPPAFPSSQKGQEGAAAAAAAPVRPQLRLAMGLVRTPSQGSLATKSPSPTPTPLSPLTPRPRATRAATARPSSARRSGSRGPRPRPHTPTPPAPLRC